VGTTAAKTEAKPNRNQRLVELESITRHGKAPRLAVIIAALRPAVDFIRLFGEPVPSKVMFTHTVSDIFREVLS
jgi:hypothetical protein